MLTECCPQQFRVLSRCSILFIRRGIGDTASDSHTQLTIVVMANDSCT